METVLCLPAPEPVLLLPEYSEHTLRQAYAMAIKAVNTTVDAAVLVVKKLAQAMVRACKALCGVVQSMAYRVGIYIGKAIKHRLRQAIPTRVLYLATHGKTYRIRKKNYKRCIKYWRRCYDNK